MAVNIVADSDLALVADRALLDTVKTADKAIAYIGDTITYQIAIKNAGALPADNVVITDPIPTGATFVAGSLIVSVPYTGSLATTIELSDPIAPGQTVTLTYKILVNEIPNPNPIKNIASVAYSYTTVSTEPVIVIATSYSTPACTVVFRNNFGQQISDLIESIALEEAALAAIENAEGAKIQKIAALPYVSPQTLLCLNKSVAEMIDSIALLETILRQKLSVVNCQVCSCCSEGCNVCCK